LLSNGTGAGGGKKEDAYLHWSDVLKDADGDRNKAKAQHAGLEKKLHAGRYQRHSKLCIEGELSKRCPRTATS